MVFWVTVDFYEEVEQENLREESFVFGDNFSDALDNAMAFYGKDTINEITLRPFSPVNLISFPINCDDDSSNFCEIKDLFEKSVMW